MNIEDGTTGEVVEQEQQQVQDPNTGEFIPKAQYDKIWGKYQTYHKEFGKPDDIREKLNRLKTYDEAIERHRAGQTSTSELTEIKNRLLQVMPELGGLSELQELRAEIANLRQGSIESRMEKSSDYLSTSLKGKGIELTSAEQEDLEDLILQKMDDEQLNEFMSGDLSVVDAIVDELSKTGLFGRIVAGKNTPPKPPSRLGTSGSPSPAKTQQPSSMKEALDAAYARIEAAKG